MGGRGSAGARGGGGSSRGIKTEKELVEAYENVNPNFKEGASYLDRAGFNNNCAKCAIAFEENARGGNVTAEPFKFGDSTDLDRSRHPEKAFKNSDTWEVGRPTKARAVAEIEASMQDFGNGSRAILQDHGVGQQHVMNVVNMGGRVVVVDSQAGKHGSTNKMLTGMNTKSMSLTRVDNLSMSDSYKDWAYKKRK